MQIEISKPPGPCGTTLFAKRAGKEKII